MVSIFMAATHYVSYLIIQKMDHDKEEFKEFRLGMLVMCAIIDGMFATFMCLALGGPIEMFLRKLLTLTLDLLVP